MAARKLHSGRTRGPTRGSGSASGSLLSCRVRVTLPSTNWLQRFTVGNTDVRVEVLDRMELGSGLTVLEVHVTAPTGGGWSEAIRSLPGVKDVELQSAGEGAETLRVFFRGPTFIPVLKRLGLLRHFPFPVQAGIATWTVVGPEAKVRSLLRTLEGEPGRANVEAVRHGTFPAGPALLTARQQEILRRAMAEGYFDVPRRISLTELAPKIGVAISTLSVTLAVIERKVLQPHV